MNDSFQRDLVAVQDELLRYAFKLTMVRDEAYDLLQETSLKALDNQDKYTPDTEAIENGVFYESKHRSGPYFDIQIDGITLLDENYG